MVAGQAQQRLRRLSSGGPRAIGGRSVVVVGRVQAAEEPISTKEPETWTRLSAV
jgi:hypothetical protein